MKQSGWLARLAYGLFTLAGVVAGVWVCAQTSRQALMDAFTRLDAPFLAAAAAVALLCNAARAQRFHLFFPESGSHVRLFGVFGLIRLLGLLMPLRSGEVVGLVLCKKQGLVPSVAEAAPAWFATRIMDLFTVVALLLFAMMVKPLHGSTGSVAAVLGAAALLGAGVVIAGRFIRLRYGACNDQPNSWWARRLAAAQNGLARLSHARLTGAMAWSAVIWLGMVLLIVLTMKAFATPLGAGACAVAALTMIAVTLLPVHGPLGLGSIELAWVATLGFAGVQPEHAAALAICFRLALTGMVLLDGSIGLTILALYGRIRPKGASDPALCPHA